MKMKKIRLKKNKKIGVFCLIYSVALLLLTLPQHYFEFLNMEKQTWAQILNRLWLYCFGAFVIVCIFFLIFGNDDKNDNCNMNHKTNA